jgi:hypothetical protein
MSSIFARLIDAVFEFLNSSVGEVPELIAAPVCPTLDTLTDDIKNLEAQLGQLLRFLQKDGQAYANAISGLLDESFEELHRLVQCISGSYDTRLDVEQTGLHTSVLKRFQEVETRSEEGFKALCAAHAKVRLVWPVAHRRIAHAPDNSRGRAQRY